jgi:hypothetical protein
MFDHLPPAADSLRPYRSQLLSQVYTGLALRNYGLGRIAEAKRQLAEAITLEPVMLEQTENFVYLLSHYAMALPNGEPFSYVNTIFQNLPDEAQRLKQIRSNALSRVSVACAFQDYFAGRRRLTVRRVLTALRYRPAWFTNRGVISILLRSLPTLLTRQHSLG